MRRSHQKATGTKIEESSFYERFTPGFAKMMRLVASNAIQFLFAAVGQPLRGPLAGFRDLIMTDSTVMRLHNLLEDAFPGARTNHSNAAASRPWSYHLCFIVFLKNSVSGSLKNVVCANTWSGSRGQGRS